MTGRLLYPRIPHGVALALATGLRGKGLAALRDESALDHPSATYNPVGGHRVTPKHLGDLREHLRLAAADLDFPTPLASRTGEFDRAMMPLIYQYMNIVPADAGQEGVWSFMALVLAPELAVWRYPSLTPERFVGVPRNVFRRLWWRAHILGWSDGAVTYRLTEDQLVQIEERPTIGGDPRIAQGVAHALDAARVTYPQLSHEDLMREAAKRLIRFTPIVDICGLRDDDLFALCREVVQSAAAALSMPSV